MLNFKGQCVIPFLTEGYGIENSVSVGTDVTRTPMVIARMDEVFETFLLAGFGRVYFTQELVSLYNVLKLNFG
jgi:hypothetical protein